MRFWTAGLFLLCSVGLGYAAETVFPKEFQGEWCIGSETELYFISDRKPNCDGRGVVMTITGQEVRTKHDVCLMDKPIRPSLQKKGAYHTHFQCEKWGGAHWEFFLKDNKLFVWQR